MTLSFIIPNKQVTFLDEDFISHSADYISYPGVSLINKLIMFPLVQHDGRLPLLMVVLLKLMTSQLQDIVNHKEQ